MTAIQSLRLSRNPVRASLHLHQELPHINARYRGWCRLTRLLVLSLAAYRSGNVRKEG